ncbi:MAG: T9SS type A sorting domain-containing protein [Flavobacteriales bacterium]|nr:T9SS type A sorting domain-containing protein [Flavobacteriales bacterium]
MKTLLLFFTFLLSCNFSIAQFTLIPDTNFENRLVWMGLDNLPLDGQVPTANIDTLLALGLPSQNIFDMTGIQDFAALEYLNTNNNQFTTLDLSQNVNLKELWIFNGQVTSINLSQNPLLEKINLSYNQINNINLLGASNLKDLIITDNPLTNLDISQNPLLERVWAFNSQISSLDFSSHPNLKDLNCSNNPSMTVLNISGAPALRKLACTSTQLSSLDLSQNPVLTRVETSFSQLTSLNTVGAFALDTLLCNSNQITSLNLSQNSALTFMNLGFNQLSCLNLKNGNNINFVQIWGNGNPSLTCVEVDDTAYSNANWTVFDVNANFSTSCGNSCSISPCNIIASYSYTDNGIGNYTFTNNSLGNFSQVHWAFGDGNISTITNPNHTFSANGTFVVALTINDSAYGGSCFDYYIDTIVVTGVPSPAQCTAGFVMYPDTSTNNITVINSSTGSNLTYHWDFGDGDTSNLSNPTHIYAGNGPYYLCLTVDDGSSCNDTYCDSVGVNGVVFKQSGFTINVIGNPIITELDNHPELNSDINIYPNPTSHQLTIDTELKLSETTIIDITGKMISTTKQNANIINVADLSSGVYFIKLITEKRIITKKFIKQ